ncbi:MAG TPA: putative lipid II flippase FtsW [Patescibacteria group bacterium]|nr:putative lipid II flippase FtsW [Patescibacteria group bacterium]
MQKTTKFKLDYFLLVLFLLVLGAGLAMLFSAQAVVSLQKQGSTTHYFIRQIYSGLLPGIVLCIIAARTPYTFWARYSPLIVLGSLALLALVEVPGIGQNLNGANRWISIGPVFFQPSELAKFALITYTAAWLSKKHRSLKDFFLGLLPLLLVTCAFAVLIIRQPDIGTMGIMVATSFIMFFLGGVPMLYLTTLLAVGSGIFFLLIRFSAYRLARLMTFLGTTSDPHGANYHINQALIAVGSGGLWGVGYGLSRQKYGYLPESMGDSIFAVMSEELGFVVTSGIIVLFMLLLIRMCFISLKHDDPTAKIFGLGITTLFALQFIINISAMIKLVPLTGVPLPFFSQGGSSMLVSFLMMGVIFNIYSSRKKTK